MASGVVANDTPYMNMTLSDQISKLRVAEEEVEKKEIEIGWLKERVKFEMLHKMKAEEELKGQRKKGKKAEERLLEVVKNQNRELSEELKKSLEAKKKIEEEQGSTIAKLRGVIRELEDENRRNEGIWKRKFFELNERVLKLEHDSKILMKEDCGDDFRVPSDSTCSRRNEDTNHNKDELGASSAGGKLGLGTIIEIESDDDDVVCTTQEEALMNREVTYPSSSEAAQKKNKDANGMLKRKFGSINPPNQFSKKRLNGVDIFIPISSSDSYELDKRRKI